VDAGNLFTIDAVEGEFIQGGMFAAEPVVDGLAGSGANAEVSG